jgi:hypothetical protein
MFTDICAANAHLVIREIFHAIPKGGWCKSTCKWRETLTSSIVSCCSTQCDDSGVLESEPCLPNWHGRIRARRHLRRLRPPMAATAPPPINNCSGDTGSKRHSKRCYCRYCAKYALRSSHQTKDSIAKLAAWLCFCEQYNMVQHFRCKALTNLQRLQRDSVHMVGQRCQHTRNKLR